MEKYISKFVRQCLHCVDSKEGIVMPRPLDDLVHGTEVGDMLHFDYLSLGESEAIIQQVVWSTGVISLCKY